MEKFTTLTALACPLAMDNVDTDQLIPARFMTRSRADGYGQYLLHDLRFDSAGTARTDVVLHAERYRGAKILLARRNFGTGSSREAAVYALADFGIRCVIASSFGDIFASNAVKNGVLPAIVNSEDIARMESGLRDAASAEMTVDLEQQLIRLGAETFAFAVDPVRRQQLLHGWDDIDLTTQHAAEIQRFRHARLTAEPWVMPPVSR